MICGDFNARIGSLSDCPDNSSIPNRKPLDHTTNSFGRLLVDFLHTLDMCTLNGRFDPLKDGFTSVSTKGLVVVDYCLVPLQHFSAFSEFHVVDIHEFVHSKNIAVDSKIPDHRLIAWKVTFNNALPDNHLKTSNQITTKRIPQDYFEDPKVHKQLSHLAAQLDEEQSHPDIDAIYTNICRLIDEQLIQKPLKPNTMYGKTNKCKPWWNSHLSELCKRVSVT